ncbi:Morc Family Cw-Type Zinc Finger Protein 3 [Manis pentadactyla]|nr:Morc Family Cw-Type Zinc Finger Protein 3 [Manis pentadactyla]
MSLLDNLLGVAAFAWVISENIPTRQTKQVPSLSSASSWLNQGSGSRGAPLDGISRRCPAPSWMPASPATSVPAFMASPGLFPREDSPKPGARHSGEGTNQIAACVLENIYVTYQAGSMLSGLPGTS